MSEVDDIITEKNLMISSVTNQEARIIKKIEEVEEEIKLLKKIPFCQELGITRCTIKYMDLCDSKELALNDKMAAYTNCINKLLELIKSGKVEDQVSESEEMPEDDEAVFRQKVDLKIAAVEVAKDAKSKAVKISQVKDMISEPYVARKQEIVDELLKEVNE